MAIDEQLRQLIAEVCKYPPQSLARQKALNRLLIQIQSLPGLYKSKHPDYLHALNRSWEWVSKNIQNFKPRPPSIQVSLVRWINGYLYWRIKDLYAPDDKPSRSFDEPLWDDEDGATYLDRLSESGFCTFSLSGIDAYIEQIQNQETQRIGLELEQYIESDPDGKLKNCHLKTQPECNCMLLIQRLRLKNPPDKLADIAREWNVNYQTLVAHWKRNCLPMLQEIALNLGYEPDIEP